MEMLIIVIILISISLYMYIVFYLITETKVELVLHLSEDNFLLFDIHVLHTCSVYLSLQDRCSTM